jgi:DNA-binding CsgD family transcriptional regulator
MSIYQGTHTLPGRECLMADLTLSGEDYSDLLKFLSVSKQKNISSDEARQLASLMPEIMKMIRLTEQLHEQQYERLVLETAEVNSGAPRGAATIIIDAEGMVVRTNRKADALLKSGKLLSVKKDHLFAVNDKDKDSLGEMMEKALGNTGAAVQDCALVGEQSDVGVHQLLALPVPVEEPPFPWMKALKVAVVVVIDPRSRVKVASDILKKLYHITPAEIGLINAMVNGIKPVQYAAQSFKSVPTVQSQRQAVFNKVGVSNQLELMSVLRNLTTSFEEIRAGISKDTDVATHD